MKPNQDSKKVASKLSAESERDRNYDRATQGDDSVGSPTSGGGRGIDQLQSSITGSPLDESGDSLLDIEEEEEEAQRDAQP